MVGQYNYIKAAQLISHSDGLIIAAGAGMGVDSGLPDFRGNAGFWQSYPALQKSGIDFQEMAAPLHFWSSPRMAWGFYGHRLALYRKTEPHPGFRILREISQRLVHGAFVYTSNVDGQFQKAGFPHEHIHECHGSIHYLQCVDACRGGIWPANGFSPKVDNDTCKLINDLPICPDCGLVARPNILMFEDDAWVPGRSDQQQERFRQWFKAVRNPVVIELGAGTAIATVRRFGARLKAPLIRINIREAWVQPSVRRVSLAMGALPALQEIKNALHDIDFFRATM